MSRVQVLAGGRGFGKNAAMLRALAMMTEPGTILVIGPDGERVIDFQGAAQVVDLPALPPPMEIKIEASPMEFYDPSEIRPAKPSKFIPSKENQPWKRNRR